MPNQLTSYASCRTATVPEDAPELADDFYLNLVDWSSTNVLGVGLGSCVYLWTAHTAQVSKLCDLSNFHDTISSVSWVQKVRADLFTCYEHVSHVGYPLFNPTCWDIPLEQAVASCLVAICHTQGS